MEIIADSIAEAWEKSIIKLLQSSNRVLTQRGAFAYELENVLFTINHPTTTIEEDSKYPYSSEFINSYIDSTNHSYEGVSIKDRLFRYGGRKIDQIERVINLLKNERYSRRGVVNLWNVELDPKSTHPPCLISLQFYLRDNLLHMTAVLRSNDAWMAAVPDMLSNVHIQQHVAERLKVKLGKYNHLSVSYHIYEPDLAKAKDIFHNLLDASK